MRKKKIPDEIKYNYIQICNLFKLNANDRFYIKSKYEGEVLTQIEWENLFVKDKFDIKKIEK